MKVSIKKGPIKYILFDVDGVLVDSEKIFNQCWLEGAKKEGYPLSFSQALQLRSLNSAMASSLFFDWFGDETAYDKVRSARKRIMADVLNQVALEIKPGVSELLEYLDGIGLKYAIVSSSPVKRCKDYMEQVGLGGKFQIFISGEMVKNGKPFPDIYTLACKTLGVLPEECLAIEDSPNGLKSAHSAGCITLMIPDLSPYSDALSEFTDYVGESLNDIEFDII